MQIASNVDFQLLSYKSICIITVKPGRCGDPEFVFDFPVFLASDLSNQS